MNARNEICLRPIVRDFLLRLRDIDLAIANHLMQFVLHIVFDVSVQRL